MSQPAFTYYGRPTFMQDVLAPLIQIERMQALVQDSILNIQELYDATPQGNTPVRLALNQAMIHLGDANRELDRQKLFQYLIVVNEIQERIRQTGRVPVVNYNDPGSDIWLTFCGNGWLQWHVSNWDLFMMRRCHDEIYLGNVWQSLSWSGTFPWCKGVMIKFVCRNISNWDMFMARRHRITVLSQWMKKRVAWRAIESSSHCWNMLLDRWHIDDMSFDLFLDSEGSDDIFLDSNDMTYSQSQSERSEWI